jgi:hypothetical protein
VQPPRDRASRSGARALRAGVAAVALALGSARVASAQPPLAPEEQARLAAGELVVERETVENEEGRWVGGTSWILVDAPVDRVDAVLFDPASWQRILPRTRRLTWIALGRGGDAVFEIEQGTALVHGTYVARVRRDVSGDTRIVRFWVDRRYPHVVDDAWGWLTLEAMPDGRTVVGCHVLVDVGPGLVRWLFEERIREAALAMPAALRRWVATRR